MINKKLLILGATMATCLTISTFADELSPVTIQICTNYINNPTTQAGKENAAALEQCYENRDQLIGVPNSAHQLTQWKANYIPPQPKVTTMLPPPPPPGTAIPQQFHSTNPNQPVVTPTYPAPAQVETVQPQPANAANSTQPQNKKKPSGINWF